MSRKKTLSRTLNILGLSPKITIAKHLLVLASRGGGGGEEGEEEGAGSGFLGQCHSSVGITDGRFQ